LRAALEAAREAAERNYRTHPNVLGVGVGRKFRRHAPTSEAGCIQFFVARKLRRGRSIGRSLPRFIYGRRPDGSVDRHVRLPTDVIHVGRIEPACSAGSQLDSETGRFGSIALLFRNGSSGGSAGCLLLLTCAHVVGDATQPTPGAPAVECGCCRGVRPFGHAILSSVQDRGALEYDVALVRIADGADLRCTLGWRATSAGTVLRGFLPRAEIHAELDVECDFAISGARPARVDGTAGTVLMPIGGRDCWVRNAFLVRTDVRRGDSGGLLYSGDRAVGILFGRSPQGWGWFHPLEDAVAHLQSVDAALEFRVF
jgi:hypothetical protein